MFGGLVGMFGGLVGAARATGGCGEATDIDTLCKYTLCGLCEHSNCNHTPYRVFMLIRGPSGRVDQYGLLIKGSSHYAVSCKRCGKVPV